MKSQKKFMITLLLTIVLSTFLLGGCGNTEPPKGSTGEAEGKVYLVGTEPTFPPFEMVDEKTNEIIGFDIDLIKAIAEDQGFKVNIQNMGFDGLVPALVSGTIDIGASGMSITPERLLEVDFSDPYIEAGLAIAVTADNDSIEGQEDLAGKKVAVQIGTTGALKAQKLKDEGLISEIKVFNTVDVVMMELASGGVDAVINDLPVTEAFIAKQPDKIKIVGDVLESDSYGFAVGKGNEELLDMINAGLKNVIENGKFEELKAQYFN